MASVRFPRLYAERQPSIMDVGFRYAIDTYSCLYTYFLFASIYIYIVIYTDIVLSKVIWGQWVHICFGIIGWVSVRTDGKCPSLQTSWVYALPLPSSNVAEPSSDRRLPLQPIQTTCNMVGFAQCRSIVLFFCFVFCLSLVICLVVRLIDYFFCVFFAI